MSVTVEFVSVFPDLRSRKRRFNVKPADLGKILDELEGRIPGLKQKLLDQESRIHPAYVVILRRGDVQKFLKDTTGQVKDGDEIVVLPLISGG
jgi:molybdopterin converting factor small subunit